MFPFCSDVKRRNVGVVGQFEIQSDKAPANFPAGKLIAPCAARHVRCNEISSMGDPNGAISRKPGAFSGSASGGFHATLCAPLRGFRLSDSNRTDLDGKATVKIPLN